MVTIDDPKLPMMPSPAGTTPRQPRRANGAPTAMQPSGSLGTGHGPGDAKDGADEMESPDAPEKFRIQRMDYREKRYCARSETRLR